MRIKMPAVRIAQGEISNLTSLSESVFLCFIFVRNLPSSNVVNTLLVCPHMRILLRYFFSLFRSVSLSCEVYSIVTARKTTRSRWYLETSELDEQKKTIKMEEEKSIDQTIIHSSWVELLWPTNCVVFLLTSAKFRTHSRAGYGELLYDWSRPLWELSERERGGKNYSKL